MKSFENHKTIHSQEEYDLSDYRETPYHHLLIALPRELAQKHLAIIETQKMNDADALQHLTGIMEKRKDATTETEISDERIDTFLRDPIRKREVFTQIETTVSEGPNIGIGSTARIKRFAIDETPMAIKYLVSPTVKTLSASTEHDMLREVERIQTVEELELRAHIERIRVPHPYFHHKNEKIQCYGMELVDGVTLAEDMSQDTHKELQIKLRVALTDVPEETIYKEVDKFFTQMHGYCLHGDIKPANIMISSTGTLYIIDFGQSVLMHDIPEKGREQVENLKENEVAETKMAIRHFLRILFQNDRKEVPKAA